MLKLSDRAGMFSREIRLTRWINLLAATVAAGLLIVAVRSDQASIQRWVTEERARVQDELAMIRARLESNLNGNMQLIRGLPGLITLEPQMDQDQFERALAPLFQGRSQVRNIAAAPDMVVKFMTPIVGNRKAVGLDYRKEPAQFDAADRARRLRRLVLAGPVDLVQGGVGFISRMPIFQPTDSGEDKFWGLVSTVIDADMLYLDSGLLNSNMGIDVGIRGKDGSGPNGPQFFGSPDVFLSDPILAEIPLPDGSWLMGAVPRSGWTSRPPGIWLQRMLFVLAGAMTIVPLLLLARTRDLMLDVTLRRHAAEEERRKLELQVLHAQKLESLGVLAGGVAHDFNNILTAILGYAQLVSQNASLDDSARSCLSQIDRAAERAAALCNQLLAYSGKGQFVIEAVDLAELIRETDALLQVSIPKKTTVHLRLRDDIPKVEADASQIRQVVMNLITNATDAIGDNTGDLTIETGVMDVSQDDLEHNLADTECVPGRYVFVRVSDTGSGMDSSTLKRVCDPFFTTKSTGRGLGMAAVLGVVRSLNGAIFCTTKPGRGAAFTVIFLPTDRDIEVVEDTRTEIGETGAATILVMDDEPEVRALIKTTLEGRGLTVICANDGLQGVQKFKQNVDEISACIVDLAMPRMGGMEALGILRRINPEIRVILMSGYAEEEIVKGNSQNQPEAFIKKPFGVDHFIGVISRVMSESPG